MLNLHQYLEAYKDKKTKLKFPWDDSNYDCFLFVREWAYLKSKLLINGFQNDVYDSQYSYVKHVKSLETCQNTFYPLLDNCFNRLDSHKVLKGDIVLYREHINNTNGFGIVTSPYQFATVAKDKGLIPLGAGMIITGWEINNK